MHQSRMFSHPREVGLRPGLRNEADVALSTASIAGAASGAIFTNHCSERYGSMTVSQRWQWPIETWRFGRDEAVLLRQPLDDRRRASKRSSPAYSPASAVIFPSGPITTDRGEVVPFPGLEVVRVVRGRHLDDARAELAVDEDRVLHDGKLPADDRKHGAAAAQLRRPGVLGMDRQGRVAEHRLGTRRRHHGAGGMARDVVPHLVERSFRLAVHHFEVRDGRLAPRAPVDDVAPAVDEPLLVELDEDAPDRAGKVRVEGEPLARPVEASSRGV